MPLRMLEVSLPEPKLDQVSDLLEGLAVVQSWVVREENGHALVRVLLEAEETEPLTDALADRFESLEDFRLLLLPVEATLPHVESATPDSAAAGAESEKKEGPRRISREELYEDVTQASRLTRIYVIMVGLAAIVAGIGLIKGDVAIIIGAMVIAPLLGPNIALSLACTLGDTELARDSLKAIAVGILTAAAASVTMGLLLPVDPGVPEIASRTAVDVGDMVLALAAGAAGSLAFTSGVPTVVVGVMVSVALLPPLVVAGLLVGAGYPEPALGALLLALTNMTCVSLASIGMFLAQRVRPRTWWEADRARHATRIAVTTWVLLLAALVILVLLG